MHAVIRHTAQPHLQALLAVLPLIIVHSLTPQAGRLVLPTSVQLQLFASSHGMVCRHDEQATHAASITEQFGNTQQALQELQAEFADQQHEQSNLKGQLETSKQLHAELQVLHTAQHSKAVNLNEQLAGAGTSVQDLQVFPSAVCLILPGILIAIVCFNLMAHTNKPANCVSQSSQTGCAYHMHVCSQSDIILGALHC